MFTYNFYPLISKPSRMTSKSSTLIDNIFINTFHKKVKSGLFYTDLSDHFPVFCLIFTDTKQASIKYPRNNVRLQKRLITNDRIEDFKKRLIKIDWSVLYKNEDVNESYNYFMELFTALYDQCFPIVRETKAKHKGRKPWITKAILTSICRKTRLYRAYLHKPNTSSFRKYTVYKNRLTRTIRCSKKQYFYNVFQKYQGNMKRTWSEINNILGNRKIHNIPCEMYSGNHKYSTREQIVDEFNSYFAGIGQKISNSIPFIPRSYEHYLRSPNNESIFLKQISIDELLKICSSLDPSKANGHDGISPRVVKSSIACFVKPLCDVFNKSFLKGVFPDALKIAKVVPLHKKKCKQNIDNYRPVAILSIFSKLLEKLMYERLHSFLIKYELLINVQFGFRKNHSTAHGVLNFSDHIISELDHGNFCVGIFMDLSKAFDTIDHHILLDKLLYYGIRGVALDWFRSYLLERKQYVVVDGVESNFIKLSCGVPQGSVLGPLLFLIYINDIIHSSNIFRFSLFADDTVVSLSHKKLSTLISSANEEILKLSLWFQSNKLLLNHEKTKYIIFHTRNRRIPLNTDPICLNNTVLQCVKTIQFLGVTIDELLDWKAHIKNVSLKVSRSVGALSRMKYTLPQNILRILYNSIILPHLSYCNIIWGNTYLSHLSQLSLLQKRAIRIITHSEYDAPTLPLFKDYTILPLKELILFNSSVFMYNFHIGNVPRIFENMFTCNSSYHTYNTRQKMLLHKPKVYTTQALKSFHYVGINIWNKLNERIKVCSTLSSFKILCKREIFKNL